MEKYIAIIIGTFFFSMVCGFICTPLIIRYCKKKNLYDIANFRKVHKGNIPRLGGICFTPSMLAAFFFALFLHNTTNSNNQITISIWSVTFFICIMIIYACGIVDDIAGLKPRTKFLIEFLAASMFPMSGLYINNLYGFFGIYNIPFYIGALITVFVIVFIVNAYNLIDGIDGLASGLSIMAFTGFFICFAINEMWIYCMLIAALMGVILSFMYFNLFGKESKSTKIFMGDSGSLTIGFILSFLFIKLSMDTGKNFPLPTEKLLIAFSLITIPIFDTFRIIIERMINKRDIFKADKNHIHHKLLRMGLNQHQALVAILAIAIFYVAITFVLSQFITFTAIFIIDLVLWYAINRIINNRILNCGKQPFVTE